MAGRAERLQFPAPESLVLAVVAPSVVGDRGRGEDAALHAEGAQRLRCKLILSPALPSGGLVPSAPWLAVAHLVVLLAPLLLAGTARWSVDWWAGRHISLQSMRSVPSLLSRKGDRSVGGREIQITPLAQQAGPATGCPTSNHKVFVLRRSQNVAVTNQGNAETTYRYRCVREPSGTWAVLDALLGKAASFDGRELVGRSRMRADTACALLNRIEASERVRP